MHPKGDLQCSSFGIKDQFCTQEGIIDFKVWCSRINSVPKGEDLVTRSGIEEFVSRVKIVEIGFNLSKCLSQELKRGRKRS